MEELKVIEVTGPKPTSIMDLPTETRAKIFRMVEQKFISNIRLVCLQWKDEVDRFYEFKLVAYVDRQDFLDAIYEWRCSQCTVWIVREGRLNNRKLLRNSQYTKNLKIHGPVSSQDLQRLISQFDNIEYLTIGRRVARPWVLNLEDTPHLAKFVNLKYLGILSVDYSQLTMDDEENPGSFIESIYQLPMMDCYFPTLRHIEISKRFPINHYATILTYILKFIAKHSTTLKKLEIVLHPLWPTSSPISSLSQPIEYSERGNKALVRLADDINVCSDQIDLQSLRKVKLNTFAVTSQGSRKDAILWKSILENQDELINLQLDWLIFEYRNQIRNRVVGFPWTFLNQPIIKSQESLVSVDLIGLSMIRMCNELGYASRNSDIVPFDLSVFRSCSRLKNLTLRCRENHGRVVFPVNPEVFDDNDIPDESVDDLVLPMYYEEEPPEVALAINASELPVSLETLEIHSYRVYTTDLDCLFQNCVNITLLYLKDVGQGGALGVTAKSMREIAKMEKLKFLDIICFNDDKKPYLQIISPGLGIDYGEEDSWLQYDNPVESAHDKLSFLRQPRYYNYLES